MLKAIATKLNRVLGLLPSKRVEVHPIDAAIARYHRDRKAAQLAAEWQRWSEQRRRKWFVVGA